MATLEDTETHKKQVVRFSTILPLPVGRQNDKMKLSTCTPRNLNLKHTKSDVALLRKYMIM